MTPFSAFLFPPQSRSGRTLTYVYDAYSQRTQLEITASGVQPWRTSYGYDNAGRLRTVLDDRLTSGQPYLYGYAANASLIAQVTTPTGMKTTKSYDIQGRLLQVGSQLAGAPSGTFFTSHAYTYDAAGQRVTETTPDRTRAFAYDQYRQLVDSSATVAGETEQFTFTFDGIGNRLEVGRQLAGAPSGTTTYTPNAVNQYTEITLAGSAGFQPAYDANGNTTVTDGKVLEYDEENRLVSVSDLTRTVVYIYDGFGRRVERIDTPVAGDLTATRYVYDGWRVMEELAWSTSTWTLSSSYTRGTDLSGTPEGAGGIGGLLALSKPNGSAWTSASYLYDGNGNVTHLVDDNGAVVARYTYGPFGERLVATGAWADVNAVQFSSKERDIFTGFYYYGFRYYNPSTGRWLTRDPIEEHGSVNLYGMVDNDPLLYVDVLGLESGETSATIDGKAAHANFGPGTQLAPDTITDKLKINPVSVVTQELKPAVRLENVSKFNAAVNQMLRQMDRAAEKFKGKAVEGQLWAWEKTKNGFRYTKVLSIKWGGRVKGVVPFVGMVPGVLEDCDRAQRAKNAGRTYDEQLREDYKDAGPYLDTPLGPMPNPWHFPRPDLNGPDLMI